ncbi:MAG: SUMF1/EgtB/PvdO family nonheme iron enzyme, partial [Planctomycetaceae bacterium]|nr:SUMF1/EgtB/PvdO family nonheme iron enzyme [Planctomycetaceae bacterium]
MTDVAAILKQIIESPSELKLLQQHLTCGPCALLDWAVSNQRAGSTSSAAFVDLMQELKDNLDVLQPFLQIPYPDLKSNPPKLYLDCFPQLQARFNLIGTALDDGDVESAITELVTATGKAWKHKTVPYVQSLEAAVGGPQPGQGNRLVPSFLKFAGSPGIRTAIENVAGKVGWSHPGLLMAGEILASFFGDQRQPDLTVRTKIMFACDHPEHPRGVLADFTIERLSGGCGLLIPAAERCGYLSMHTSFSTGLQNALWAARNYATHHFGSYVHDFDWRWSIDLLRPVKSMHKSPVQLRLEGPSAEVSLACGLIAAHGSNPDNQGGIDPLDPNVGATASIRNPGESDVDLLKGVTSIDVKTLVGSMETGRLLQVVVACDQDQKWIPNDPRFEFPAARTLAESYQLTTRFPRLTRGVNRHLAERATKLAEERCTPYVLPEIAEVLPSQEHTGPNGKQEQLRPLTEGELEQLITGQLASSAGQQPDGVQSDEQVPAWIGNRVRIFADSGLGKSVFILHCEAAIAHSGQNLLPLRLGRCTGEDGSLAQITWTGDVDQVIDRLADLPSVTHAADAFAAEQPQPNWVISSEKRKEWFRWMIKHGRVVFLLDAVDQIEKAVDGLGLFLGSGDVRKCPVIITGRPETLQGRRQAWVENRNWKTLQLLPFDGARQRQYLGDTLANELIPHELCVNWNTADDELRRRQWKDLLEVPLLLSLMKQLATSPEDSESLSSIRSRYELYDRAVTHLIRKGFSTLEKVEDQKLLQSEIRVREVLGTVSWFMVSRHDFTGILQGKEFQALAVSKLLNASGNSGDVLMALQQVDLTTAFQVFDELGESALSFRHRSFMEFFAGCHLMDQIPRVDEESGESTLVPRVSDKVREKKLQEIHDTLDPQGDLLPHMLTDRANRPADWHDTLRFALSHASSNARTELAMQLIELGNPWVIAESMKRDNTRFSHQVECLAAWLVHGDFPNWFNYREALKWVHGESGTDVHAEAAALMASDSSLTARILQRSTRDAACLGMQRKLLPNPASLYAGLSAEAELLDQLTRLPGSNCTWNFLESFVNVQAGTFDLRKYPEHKEIRPQRQSIRAFALADFPVANAVFEVFCPSHRRHRDQYSRWDDQPAVHINFYMAKEFCEWLSALTGKTYRLPTEWEWEWACRWHNTRKQDYWWWPEMAGHLCLYGGWEERDTRETNLRRTRSRAEAISAYSDAGKWHPSGHSPANPGLLDLSGNVLEWCENLWDPNGDRKAPGA